MIQTTLMTGGFRRTHNAFITKHRGLRIMKDDDALLDETERIVFNEVFFVA